MANTDPDLTWTLLGSTVAYRGFLTIESRRYALPDGRETRWDILAGGRTVAVVALTEGGSVVLARQFRPGPGVVLDELPGGLVDRGEAVAVAAARELLEETGYAAAEVRVVGSTWPAGFSTIERFAAIALGCHRIAEPSRDGDEFCQAVEVDLDTFRDRVRTGALTDQDAAYRCLDDLGLLAT